ncbi:protein of unknown function [Beijerinckiaceae bacterium RH AL1]|nr:protein of unknown function [Beijerinckiaceae bacterium RH AL8]VVB42588.1 protein of unknown function [Beijerinckiaceae bacterium RH CH11]VVC53392.1 protein of unknown function [Beijerinckiaceae bacterium RH AL1]
MTAPLTLPPMRVSAVTLQTRLPLYPDEPLFAYVARLALAAGHHTLSGFLDQNVGDHVALADVFSGAALHDVAQVVDIEPRYFEASTFVRDRSGLWHHPRARLPASALSFRSIRWCPQCAEDGAWQGSPHISLLWTLAAVRACPEHGCRLIERRLRRNAIDEWARFPGDADPRSADRVASRDWAEADPRDVELAKFLQSRLGFSGALDEPPPLRALPLDEALIALKIFGGLAKARFDRRWAADGIDEANGFELLRSAPLADLLDELAFSFAHRITLPRPREFFGNALCDFVESSSDESEGGIKAVLRQHAARHLRADDRAGGFATGIFSRGRLDVSEVGRLLQVSTDRITDARMAIAGHYGRRAPIGPIGDDERAVLTEFTLQALDKTTFAAMLGVSALQLDALKDLGLAVPYGAPAIRALYLRPQITLVLAQLGIPGAPMLRRPPRDGVVLTKASSLGGELFERCCRALADGMLRPVGVTGHHRLDEVVVSLADLQALRPADTVAGEQLQLGLATADSADGAMLGGFAQVASALGCSEETAAELVDSAGVGRRMALRRRGFARPLFGRDEIAVLHDAWVSLHELDRRLPESRVGLIDRLTGVPCLAGSTSQFPFFDRAAAEAILWPDTESDAETSVPAAAVPAHD